MESLLTLTVGEYRSVELTLRITVALVGMVALLLALSTACVASRFRFPLCLAAVALGGAGWFESGVWQAWRAGFELAGTSYCVSGQLLAGEDRIIAWCLGVPALLVAFGLLQLPDEKKPLGILCWTALGIAVIGPFYDVIVVIGFLICWRQLRVLLQASPSGAFRAETHVALASVLLGMLLTELGHFHLLTLGKSADTLLVHGEILRSLTDILYLVVPAACLLIGAIKIPEGKPSGRS